MLEKLKSRNDDLAILAVRIGVGLIFIVHGYGKITGMEGTISFFSMLGLGAFWAYLVAWVEFLGGLAVLVGVFSRYAALLLAVVMVVAIFLVKAPKGFGAMEIDLLLLLSNLAIAFAGSGKYNIKSALRKSQVQ